MSVNSVFAREDAADMIRTPDQRLRVFVSSTLGELAPERDAIGTAIRTLRLSPVMFELGARPHPPQDLYRSYLAQSDVFVGIYWQSYGWVAPGAGVSGIEDEYLLSGDLPKLIYIKEPAPDRDPRLEELLERIRRDGKVSFKRFSSAGDLAELLLDDLALLVTERYGAREVADGRPTGDVTFLFSDIDGSTPLAEQLGSDYGDLLVGYRSVIRAAVQGHSGHVVDFEGDGAFAVFPDAAEAAAAAFAIQHELAAARWPDDVDVVARIGLHSGMANLTAEGYVGLEVHRAARIGSAGHGGQILISASTRALLEEEAGRRGWQLRDLGSFVLKGLSRTERLAQLGGPGPIDEFPSPRARSAARVRLPLQMTTLVDRRRELDDIVGMLARPGVRLVTLTGAGGIGKTRLALAVGEQMAAEYPDGVFFVNLASLSDPAQVLPTVAETLGLPLEGTAIESVAEGLAHRRTLLLLDNFEQVVGAGSDVVDLLERCPGLDVMITSRVVLRLSGEHEYQVGPLAVPASEVAERAAIAESPAVQLFVERARSVQPGFELTEDNRTAVASIVQLVDGLPLAIELAAARLRMFTPAALEERLRSSFDTLGGGITDLPARQQTLRATVDWSYRLLGETERAVFRRLAVFTGSWTLAGADAVAGDIARRHGADPVDVVEALIVHSLVRPATDAGGEESRFRLLATLREYAEHRMVEEGEIDQVRQLHTDHVVAVAEHRSAGLSGSEQTATLRALDPEWTDIQVVAERLIEHADPATLVRLLRALWVFMWLRGHVAETAGWLDRACPGSRGFSSDLSGLWLWLRACAAFERGDYDDARRLMEESLDLVPEEDIEVRAWGRYIRAALLPVSEQDSGTMRREFEAVRREMRAAGDRWGEGWALSSLGMRATSSGDTALAERYYTEGLGLAAEIGSEPMLGQFHTQLAVAYLAGCRYDDAHDQLTTALSIHRGFHFREGLAYVLEAVAMLGLGEDRPQQAMLALGAAEGIRSRLDLRPWPSAQWVMDELAAAADAIADPEAQAARLAGARMDPLDAAQVALKRERRSSRRRRSCPRAGRSERARDVAGAAR